MKTAIEITKFNASLIQYKASCPSLTNPLQLQPIADNTLAMKL